MRKERVFLSEIFISTATARTQPESSPRPRRRPRIWWLARAKGEKFSELARDNSDNPKRRRRSARSCRHPESRSQQMTRRQIVGRSRRTTSPIRSLCPTPAISILRVDEHHQAGPGGIRGSGRQIMRTAVSSRDASRRSASTSPSSAQDAFLEIKEGYTDSAAALRARIRPVERSGAAQAGDRDQGRSGQQAAPQKASVVVPMPGTKSQRKQQFHEITSYYTGRLQETAHEARNLPRMKSPTIATLEVGQPVTGAFLVTYQGCPSEERQVITYLSLMLGDRTGDIDAKMWDNVAEIMDTFERDDFVQGQGPVADSSRTSCSCTIHKLQAVDESRSRSRRLLPGVQARSRRDVRRAARAYRGDRAIRI